MRKKNYLISEKNPLSIYIIKPSCYISKYQVELMKMGGYTKQSNRINIQQHYNKVLRTIVDAPGYITNKDLHRGLEMKTVDEIFLRTVNSHERRLFHHMHVEAIQLLDKIGLVKTPKPLKRFESFLHRVRYWW